MEGVENDGDGDDDQDMDEDCEMTFDGGHTGYGRPIDEEDEELLQAFSDVHVPNAHHLSSHFSGFRSVTPERPSNPMAQMLAYEQQQQQQQQQQHEQQQLTLNIPQHASLRPIHSPSAAWSHGARAISRSPHPNSGMVAGKRTGEASPLPMLMSSEYFSPRKMKRSSMLDSGRSNSMSSHGSVGSLGMDSLTRSTSGIQYGKYWPDASSMARAPSRCGIRETDEGSMYGSDLSLLDDSSEILYTPRDHHGERSRTFSIHSLSPSPRPGQLRGGGTPKSISGASASATPDRAGNVAAAAAARSVDGLSPLRDVMRQVGL
ncbi:Hypothetical Protein FCC1311_075552 [Hondaea fermentalgiana]|uniref:Uncharacterized protein n=1 Tax=Hondaea fermentalgiana TaxID=2315210 RepID=A0A2R5GSI3_9STRA|nr:Hypothetical Protein FCC1311_075552 [Hondaea fermentalgiana]|eukprot:GBG31331.1 Hypothetical Protein FCC1311_075552 [Hondaea fermentalgiana]